jgi:hypothetical protein
VILALAPMMIGVVMAASPVDVRSSTNCPSTEAIVEQLLPLLPATAGLAEGQDLAEIKVGAVQARGAMELHLRLVRPDGSEVGDRNLVMRGACQDMAEAVAMVIAAWETKPLSGAVPDDVPAVGATISVAQVHAFQSASAPIRPWQILVAAGAGAAFVGGVAATGGVDVRGGPVTSHWQLRFGVASETARQFNLSPGRVDWRRTSAALGVCWHLRDPSWLFSLDAGPVAGWATLAGSGFSPNDQNSSFDYGFAAGLRAGRSFGRWSLWAEWRTNLWAQVQRATVTGADFARELPQLDTAVSLGLSAMLFR